MLAIRAFNSSVYDSINTSATNRTVVLFTTTVLNGGKQTVEKSDFFMACMATITDEMLQ
jgi:hypothetical protein